MQQAIYSRICDIIYDESGIRIKPGKEAMVSARLSGRIREIGLRNEAEYLELLERDLKSEVVTLLDLISTNVTHFFRENEHFEFLGKTVDRWQSEGQTRFRFWCAAASTGEEPYSIAMTLHESARRAGKRLDMRLLATDISTEVLAHASRGTYTGKSLESVPASYRARYFESVPKSSSLEQTANQLLRDTITFRRLNLSTPPFPVKGPMDVVFCRNVMFYFDDPIKDALVDDIHRMLRPDGFVITGKSESVPALSRSDRFDRVGPSIFQRVK